MEIYHAVIAEIPTVIVTDCDVSWSLAWLADRPQVTSPIVGARTLEQLQGSLAVAEVHLDGDAARRLTEVSEPALPDYPYGELGIDQRSRTLP